MDRKELVKFTVSVGLIVACATAFLVTGFFLTVLKNHPNAFASVLGSGDKQIFLYPSEARVVDVVRKTDPAVVAITISKNVPVFEEYSSPVPFDGLFGEDGRMFSFPQLRQRGTELREIGGGSGFLVSDDGFIVTNSHVVDDESAAYTVYTNEGREYNARVVARDPILDIAIIKIDGSNFKYLDFGNSDAIETGQSVIAIGNALGEFRNTVSVGVVSGLSRTITATNEIGSVESLEQLIQTDAAINQGNSGGPLLDLSGKVIGVNVAVASGAENIGFALSANSVKDVVESVKETGRIVRPYLGVRYIPVTDELKERNNLPVDYGVLIQRGENRDDVAVIPGSPADKAGIVENDIILEIDGERLEVGRSLGSVIREKDIGDTIDLKIISKGKQKEVSVRLEELAAQ